MTLAFTICSINYLAQAQTLGQSLQEQNPSIEFVIGLVDRLDKVELEPDKIPPFQMLEIDKINIQFSEDVVGFNTASVQLKRNGGAGI